MKIFFQLFLIPALTFSAWAEVRIDVREKGAEGDGKTLDTAAIQKAIDACAEAGGGTVAVPSGVYLMGSIQLRSRVGIYLDKGARLLGSTDLEAYRVPVAADGKPKQRLQALIQGEGVEDVVFSGTGTIDGNKVFNPNGEEKMRGPHTIFLMNCRRFTLRDITIVDSANYALYFSQTDDVEVRNAKFIGGWDGVHWRGTAEKWCHNASIIGCQFHTGDDAIAGRYWRHTVIKDCLINSSCNGIRLIGPATDLAITNNTFRGPGEQPHRTSGNRRMLAGILLQPGSWDSTQGALDQVRIENNVMSEVASPVTLFSKPGNTVGKITVKDLRATGVHRAAMSMESWAETPVEEVLLENVSVEYVGGGKAVVADQKVSLPGLETRSLPAWGLYAHGIKKLTLHNVHFSLAADDFRPVITAEEVDQLDQINFQYTRVPGVNQAIVIIPAEKPPIPEAPSI